MTINSAAAVDHGHVHRGGRHDRAWTGPRCSGHHPERHLEGVPGAEGIRLPAPAERPAGHRPHALRHGRAPPLAPGVHLGLPHPGSRLDGGPGAGLHAGQRVRLRGGGAWRPDWRSTTSRPASASSSTPTWTSSRRSPSTGRPVASGPAGCATATAPPTAAPLQLRFHTQTAGVSLTAQQPEVNLARVAIEALAGVLGGTQSLHTDSFDEALALPTEQAARLALRTQQVIAEETGVVHVADPLGGSWFVESADRRAGTPGRGDLRPPRRGRLGLDARGHLGLHRGRLVHAPRSPTPPTGSNQRSPGASGSRSA